MNKQNKILLGMLAFIVACTIGYALFSETITINGTATAKGDWELTTTCTAGISSELSTISAAETGEVDISYKNYSGSSTAGLTTMYPESYYSNDSCTVVGNTVTFHSDLSMPTARRYFTIKVQNSGSIPIGNVEFNTETTTISGTLTTIANEVKNVSTSDFKEGEFVNYIATAIDTKEEIEYFEPGISVYYIIAVEFPEKINSHVTGTINGQTIDQYTDVSSLVKAVDLNVSHSRTLSFEQVTAE